MKTHQTIQDIRVQYGKSTLSKEELNANPLEQFQLWFDHAREAEIPEVNTMILSTVSADNKPSSRVVLLKEITTDGIIFYTNYHSRKGREIESNPNVSVVFLWKEIERQVRIEGVATKIATDKSLKYFQSRPKGSQIGSSASEQSKVIENRDVLENRKKELEKTYKELEVLPLPLNWGGYLIQPQMIEFWQGRENRLHDRFQYSKTLDNWKIERLSP